MYLSDWMILRRIVTIETSLKTSDFQKSACVLAKTIEQLYTEDTNVDFSDKPHVIQALEMSEFMLILDTHESVVSYLKEAKIMISTKFLKNEQVINRFNTYDAKDDDIGDMNILPYDIRKTIMDMIR